MTSIRIPVSELEYIKDSNIIWIHSPYGATVLRIKCTGKIKTKSCDTSPVAHGDIMVQGNIEICVPSKRKKEPLTKVQKEVLTVISKTKEPALRQAKRAFITSRTSVISKTKEPALRPAKRAFITSRTWAKIRPTNDTC
jgi:hypothetical protein